MLIEYPDPVERSAMLAKLIGIANRTWVHVQGCRRVYAAADEDPPRETERKTASVHFLAFELDRPVIAALRAGASLAVGVDHPAYSATAEIVDPAVCESLLSDLTG
jgi:hypothetical protein